MDNLLPSYDEVVAYVYEQFALAYHAPDLSLDELKSVCDCSEGELNRLKDVSLLKAVGNVNFKSYTAPVFFGDQKRFNENVVVNGQVQFDVYLNSFLLISGLQEWLCETKDKQDRFPYSESIQSKVDFIKIPAATIYFEFLAEAIRAKGHQCDPIDFNENVIFTHDIDQVRSGWFEDVGHYIKNPSFKAVFGIARAILGKITGTKDSYYYALLKMEAIDKKYNLPAISFMMAEKSHDDADHHLENLSPLWQGEQQRIGLHPGFFTYNNKANFVKQLDKVEALYKRSEKIVRQHYLKYDVKQTTAIHEELKITEDYTLGFAEQHGFRNSIATPFYLYRFDEKRASKVLEIPLYFMDGTLHHYMKDNSTEGKDQVVAEIKQLHDELNISFSVLFHNSVFTDLKYFGFTEMYEELIRATRK